MGVVIFSQKNIIFNTNLVVVVVICVEDKVDKGMELNNKRKHYVKIDRNTTSDQVFALLDAVESDEEDDIENLMNDSDTEFVGNEDEIGDDKEGENENVHDILVPDANIHLIPNATKEKENKINEGKKKSKTTKEVNNFVWKKTIEPHKIQPCLLNEEVLCNNESNHSTPYELFKYVANFETLTDIIVEQSNLYASQNGNTFETNQKEITAFLGINFIMSINQLPTIQSYWECGQFIGNEGIRNTMTRQRFKEILRNLHFADNTKNDRTDKGYKIRPVIDHFNESFSNAVSNADMQSVDEHMVKFKGRSSMKQYVKKKPIKWGFKFWFRCSSKTGYLYQLDLYLGKKDHVEYNLGEGVVLDMCKPLENTFCTVFFDNFFNSPRLISSLFKKGIYGIGTVQSNRKGMPTLLPDKKMKRGDFEFQLSKDIGCCKWMDSRSVVLLFTNIEGLQAVSSVQRRMKGSSSKVSVSCPDVIKRYNKGMGGVDLFDQRTAAYHLDRKSSIRFYLRIFFDLMDASIANSFIAYNMLHPGNLTLLDFKIAVATHMIGPYTSRKRAAPENNAGSKKAQRYKHDSNEIPCHLPEFQTTRHRCSYCYAEGADRKTFVRCNQCGIFLCLVKERNCFYKHHYRQ